MIQPTHIWQLPEEGGDDMKKKTKKGGKRC